MPSEARCPTCGASLPSPESECAFCAEARQLLRQLVEQEEVRLCTRCGQILEEGEETRCERCSIESERPSVWRSTPGPVTRWLYERSADQPQEEEETCPHCGEALGPQATFCSHCGQRIGPAAEPRPLEETMDRSLSTDPERSFQTGPAGIQDRAAAVEGRTGDGPKAQPAFLEQAQSFLANLLRPPKEGEMPGTIYQIGGFFREIFQGWTRATPQQMLWVITLVLLLALAAVLIVWFQLLNSGDFVFR